MRISLNNIREIEGYIDGTMDRNDAVLFEEKMRGDSLLRMNVILQEKVLAIIRMYHRKKLKMELEEVHHRIFIDPGNAAFKKSVMRIFSND